MFSLAVFGVFCRPGVLCCRAEGVCRCRIGVFCGLVFSVAELSVLRCCGFMSPFAGMTICVRRAVVIGLEPQNCKRTWSDRVGLGEGATPLGRTRGRVGRERMGRRTPFGRPTRTGPAGAKCTVNCQQPCGG